MEGLSCSREGGRNEGIRTGVKRELKDGENKRMIKFDNKSVKGHSSRCVRFDNGKTVNLFTGMAKQRNPRFIMIWLICFFFAVRHLPS